MLSIVIYIFVYLSENTLVKIGPATWLTVTLFFVSTIGFIVTVLGFKSTIFCLGFLIE